MFPLSWHDGALVATHAMAAAYFVRRALSPAAATRAHERLRQDWMQAIAQHPGSEVLAVQTIRNSLMSCTMTATTATLAFMGGVTLLHSGWPDVPPASLHGGLPFWNALAVLVLLALTFLTSLLAARYWHHAGFVAGMPIASTERAHWQAHGQHCLVQAGRYYALSLRLLMWTAPLLLAGLHPLAGLPAGLVLLAALWSGLDTEVA